MSGQGLFARGEVVLIDPERRRARVKFPSKDGVVSFWLSVVASSTTGMRGGAMPRIGQQVACLVDWRAEDGVILGGTYNDKDKPPTTKGENDHTAYEDGAVREHDPVTKVRGLWMPDGGTDFVDVGGTRIKITKDAIITNKPITTAAIPPMERRGG